jgi:hypothetical protein
MDDIGLLAKVLIEFCYVLCSKKHLCQIICGVVQIENSFSTGNEEILDHSELHIGF